MGSGQGSLISALLLAAGESTRMGEMKQLLLFGEETMLEKSLSALLKSEVGEIVLVLGHAFEKILNSLKISDPRMKIVLNRHFREGMSTSIRAGLGSVSPQAEAVLIALGDQPNLTAEVVNRIIASYKKSGKGIVYPAFKKKRGHPVLFGNKYFRLLRALRGDEGGRSLLVGNPSDIEMVPVPRAELLWDFDTPSDLESRD